MTIEHPKYLCGYTGGERVHAVKVDDPRYHGFHEAVCGTFCETKPFTVWTNKVSHSCARCRKIVTGDQAVF